MKQLDLTRFENLTIEELRTIATEVGINFTVGNENIADKEEFLMVLDETSLAELEESYQRVLKNREQKK